MTNPSATALSSLAQARQLRLEQPPDLLVGDAACAQLVHGRRDDRLAGAHLVGQLFRTRVAGYEGAGALTELDDPFVLELAIRLGHGVRIDHELLRKRTNAGQLVTRTQRSRLDAV